MSKAALNPNYKTGLCINRKKPSPYNSWQNMKQRCLNPKHPKYPRYGGRGISIHEDWLNIEGFINWAFENGWKEGLTLDRVDNNGNYSPNNCQWVTASANSRKKSTTKISNYRAEEIRERVVKGESEYDLAEEYGVVHGTIWFIVNGYTHVEDGVCSDRLQAHTVR